MKISKKYVLYVNPMLGTAYYGTSKFNCRIWTATFGQIYDCTLSQLKYNLKDLLHRNYTISKRKY